MLLLNVDSRRSLVERDHPELSLRRQCELLSLARSGLYYETRKRDDGNVSLMHLIDEIFTESPFFGYRRVTATLHRKGFVVNCKRVLNLMRIMGLEAIYPKKNTSAASREHLKYPYLLKGLEITHANQVWSTDITYIRMRKGFLYLTAIMDWYSRYVLSWRLSNTLDVELRRCPEGSLTRPQEPRDNELGPGLPIYKQGVH